ncbi:MAG: hypothetical protein L0Z62_27940 [Gemmataceae bacterium]|nr:hypothetical protein [Gemmataceae bacterium]
MSATQAPDPARLEELRRRFDHAACDHPNVDAVVVWRPDLRREETERQAHNLHAKPADPASDNYAAELTEQMRGAYAAMRCALEWEEWIPPSSGSIEQLGGQRYWSRVIRADEYPELCDLPADSKLWQCTLFGPPARDLENAALRLFSVVATDAARLILPPSKAEGTALLSRWLIHLADRPEPIVPDARRRYLTWPGGGCLSSPMWIPVTPLNPRTCWWAVRLPNVFQVSRIAIEQAIDLAARPGIRLAPSPPAPGEESNWEAVLEAVADDNAIAIINVAKDATKTADEKMRAIYAIDSRALGWTSEKWAKVLNVTGSAIRQVDWWRIDRVRLRGRD